MDWCEKWNHSTSISRQPTDSPENNLEAATLPFWVWDVLSTGLKMTLMKYFKHTVCIELKWDTKVGPKAQVISEKKTLCQYPSRGLVSCCFTQSISLRLWMDGWRGGKVSRWVDRLICPSATKFPVIATSFTVPPWNTGGRNPVIPSNISPPRCQSLVLMV